MRVTVLGARGQLGHDLVAELRGCDVTPLTHADLDVCDADGVRAALRSIRPHVVINTAAFHRVDECETDPARAFAVNTFAVRDLARACADRECVLVHVSTDYVFGGEKPTPYTEEDAPKPLNVYGVSKLSGEYFVAALCPMHFIVRTSGLYGLAGASGKGGNFVETMLRLARAGTPIRVVDDQVLTPTYTADLAQAIASLIRTEAFGLYHINNSGQCSWHRFAATTFELAGLKPELSAITTQAFGATARRPLFSVLAHKKFARLTSNWMRPWQEALKAYLRAKGSLARA
ncbi:MAG: dTDP-4-dehydrorhamnose reductase [Bacillati bacterium ANGP1]|uniref:dTDP-4-dehydrorhamnose reductase n=1 Tax=Candidatus Segetimicrobium genomatis TaxID=2569760 RepID=A0A537JFL3_9BACT|nr:MAG: dTDP-4-dehydrorhamnose reductase [Terrabacteria group bacterium ANGP1]